MNLKAAIPFKAAILFTSLALGMALLCGLSVALAARGSLPFAMRAFNSSMGGNSIPGILLWAILAGFGPAIAAILTAAYLQGREGLRELWRTVVRWRAAALRHLLHTYACVRWASRRGDWLARTAPAPAPQADLASQRKLSSGSHPPQKTLQPRQSAMYPLLLTRLSDVTLRARWTP